jgi:hypothetical protein
LRLKVDVPKGQSQMIAGQRRGLMLRLKVDVPKGQSQIIAGQRPGSMLRIQFDVPKGQSQISPGQRPGNRDSKGARALKGRHNSRFFGRAKA